jgi:hypothetical protein
MWHARNSRSRQETPFNRNPVALGLAQYLRLIDESVAATVLPIGLAARTLRP